MTETIELRPALSISGASCQGCAKKIRTALESIAGDTERVQVNLDEQTVALPEG
ncbi:heavy-metal-associated domain-containing protein [Marinobacter koreensis]